MYQLKGKGLTIDKHEEAFNKLNAKQQDAVLQIEGPVLVLAGPGTGKTEVLAVRIGQILKQQDVNPYNILCLTYSNAAVDAMRKRLLYLIGPDAERIEIFTYHSFCNKIINKFYDMFVSLQEMHGSKVHEWMERPSYMQASREQ